MNRTASINIEGHEYTATLRKGCPQGSKLGPLLWNVAADAALRRNVSYNDGIITAYADDLAIVTGAARVDTALSRLMRRLDDLLAWANKHGLKFSAGKSQAICLKGGRKPNFIVKFGSGQNAEVIRADSPIRYLGVLLDYKRTFWQHVVSLVNKNADWFSKIRNLMSANWGVSQGTARILYKAVFIPRMVYAASTWEAGARTRKAICKLETAQRKALLAVTGAYRTASTHALQVVAGLLPLDLEIRLAAARQRADKENHKRIIEEVENTLLDEWQDRWDASGKGRWSHDMIPNVRWRYRLPMTCDHFTTQMLTGHGDFKGRLHSFKLVDNPNCRCGGGSETVRHVLLACPRTSMARSRLIRVVTEEGEQWPPVSGIFLRSKKLYEALRQFSREALTNRTDR